MSERAFHTAAARAAKSPIKLIFDTPTPEDPDEVTAVMVRPDLSGLALSASIARIGKEFQAIRALGDELDPTDSESDALNRVTALIERSETSLRDLIRGWLIPSDRDAYDRKIAWQIDMTTGLDVMTFIRNEVSPLDPTKPQSSSAGSNESGPASTDGASPAESTPPTSRSID